LLTGIISVDHVYEEVGRIVERLAFVSCTLKENNNQYKL